MKLLVAMFPMRLSEANAEQVGMGGDVAIRGRTSTDLERVASSLTSI